MLRFKGVIWEQLLDAHEVTLHVEAIPLGIVLRGPS